MPIVPLHVNDTVQMKKKHPCGGDLFLILRVGSEVRVKCTTCGRDMTLDRIKLEKCIRKAPSVCNAEKATVHQNNGKEIIEDEI